MICNCPLGVAIGDLTIVECPENFGQIQKVIFQRQFKTDGVLNTITDTKLKASWTPLLEAADSTKAVLSPFIQAPESEAGAARTFGGGNDTLDGQEEIIGREPTTFTGVIRKSQQVTIKQLKQYQCETVAVYFVNANGQIGCIADDVENPASYRGIPISSLFIADKGFGMLENPDGNNISFSMKPNWSDNFKVITPTDFNALTDLVKTVAP